jgi:spore coat polysaccharide biosynthesis protein SpsF
MSSRRCPGKVLRPVADKPLLQYLLERLARASLDGVVVATSRRKEDDAVEELCVRLGVECRRGPLQDVAGRFLAVVEEFDPQAFVRVSGDSPLLDPALVARAVEVFRRGGYDLVTNVQRRSFPHGQSVEVVDSDTFRRVCPRLRRPEDREHVTPYFYRHAERFRIHNLACPQDLSQVQMAVDSEEDLARFAAIVERMDRPHWQYGLEELLALEEWPR